MGGLKRLISPRLLRFALVGFSGVFVNLGCLALFADILQLDRLLPAAEVFDTPFVLSSALAIEVSVVWNFLLNNAWTFKDRNEGARSGFLARLFKYHLVSLVGMALQLGCFVVVNAMLLTQVDELGPFKYLSQLMGIAFAMAWNFLSNFYFTWRQSEPSSSESPSAMRSSSD